MDNGDILIYAAIAAFLLSRLWSVLGQRGEDDDVPERPNPFASPPRPKDEDDEAVIVLEGKALKPTSDVLTQAGHARTSLAGQIDQIKTLDPRFDEKRFLEGAKKAFLEIIKAFAEGDLSRVERFLGPNVLTPFKHAIDERHAQGQRLENKVERIAAADIVAARLDGDQALLTVEFVTYQTNRLVQNGSLAEPANTEEIRDKWVFRRTLTDEDVNWILSETLS